MLWIYSFFLLNSQNEERKANHFAKKEVQKQRGWKISCSNLLIKNHFMNKWTCSIFIKVYITIKLYEREKTTIHISFCGCSTKRCKNDPFSAWYLLLIFIAFFTVFSVLLRCPRVENNYALIWFCWWWWCLEDSISLTDHKPVLKNLLLVLLLLRLYIIVCEWLARSHGSGKTCFANAVYKE